MTTKTATMTVTDVLSDAPIILGDDRPTIDITPMALALELLTTDPSGTILSFQAEYSMDAKGKMLKTNNPYIGKGLVKVAKTQATARFNYDAKVAKRDGEPAKTDRKPWHTVIMLNGKPSALSVHKGDVLTDENDDAVYAADGSLTFTADEPRLYLRYEVQRTSGVGVRASRKMRSTSEYRLNGEPIATELVKPYLPNRKPRTDETDFQLTALDNLTALAINGQRYRLV